MNSTRWTIVFCAALFGGLLFTIAGLRSLNTGFVSLRDSHENRWRCMPLRVPPVPYIEGTISHDDLRRVALALVPRWTVPKVATVLHAVRLWGLRSHFSDDPPAVRSRSRILSGMEMVQLGLDDRFLHESLVAAESILYRTPSGIAVKYGDTSNLGHCDQLLEVAAEIGLAAESPVHPSGGQAGTLNDVIRDSLRSFVIDQELEFTAIAYSRWLPPEDHWTNRFGESTTFDQLAEALLKRPIGQGACYATHVPYALVSILRANDSHRIISSATTERIEKRLRDLSGLLERSQAENGGWFADWAESARASSKNPPDGLECIYVTGHQLEWIALAPDRVRPPRKTVAKAARLLTELILQDDATTLSNSDNYAPFSHAARALMLLNLVEASELISS
jgi:hypothetical protein